MELHFKSVKQSQSLSLSLLIHTHIEKRLGCPTETLFYFLAALQRKTKTVGAGGIYDTRSVAPVNDIVKMGDTACGILLHGTFLSATLFTRAS